MNLNLSIIDQRVQALAEIHFPGDRRGIAKAFTHLCLTTMLELDQSEAIECITEGAHDADVDALHATDVQDNEFTVTLVQAKYRRELTGDSAFPANSVKKIIGTIQSLFDPSKQLVMNHELQARAEEIRSLVRDGYIPLVRVMLCNNGQPWGSDAEAIIAASGLPSGQVTWSHVNHDVLIERLQKRKQVNADLKLTGKAIVEDFDFRRVLVGKVAVSEIKRLFDQFGTSLLERNIRRYLGLRENSVNQEIAKTLLEDPKNFYFKNNGITITCKTFRHNALQAEDAIVKVEDLHVINGGQTSMTICETLKDRLDFEEAFVLVRLYEFGPDTDVIAPITYATNRQSPVELRDLKSNDSIQQNLEAALQPLGYFYARKREAATFGPETITPAVAAEAVYAVWREKPHAARFSRSELFGKLYDHVFTADLNGAQLVIAVLVFRMVENQRKRGGGNGPRPYLPYASHFLAMLVGRQLLGRTGLTLEQVDHRSFERVRAVLDQDGESLYAGSLDLLEAGLRSLHLVDATTSRQRLAATFRRGDLLEVLQRRSPAGGTT